MHVDKKELNTNITPLKYTLNYDFQFHLIQTMHTNKMFVESIETTSLS